jgi:Tol biopolymer transport system component
LKPSNVKVREDGRVKVLDFGLAKTMEASGVASSASQSPTLTTPAMTQAGIILGTAAYMSPEQVRGRSVDRRSDVWAFGCVLFEMLTGRRPFPAGETVADTLANVLTREPDWQVLPAATPRVVRSLLQRCLRKDPRRRLPDIAAARIELEDAASESASPAPPSTEAVSPRRERVWAGLAILFFIAAVVLAARIVLVSAPDPQPVRFDVPPPRGSTFIDNQLGGTATGQPLSPDGRMLAFILITNGRKQLWVRPLDSVAPQLLPGTEGASRPAWSPDGQLLAFFADGKLKRVAIDGGPPETVCDEKGRDVAWGAGNVLLIGGQGGPLLQVPASGGRPVPATELGPEESTHDYPDFLPDGRRFLYMARRGVTPDRWDVYVGSLDSKERRLLPGIHSAARYSPTGHVVFSRGGTLMVQPVDSDTLAFIGDAFPLAEGAYRGTNAPFSASANGSLAYVGQETPGDSQLILVDRSGRQLAEMGPAGEYRNVDLSPDGRYVAFDRGGYVSGTDLFVLDLERGSLESITATAGTDAAPIWSPDGRQIAYLSSRDPAGGTASATNITAGNLYHRGVGVVASETLLLKTDAGKTPTDWSRNGYLAYTSRDDVWALLLPGTGDPKPPLRVTETPFVESNARISPDGRWIAYQSNESSSGSQEEVYVQSFPQAGGRQKVSTRGGFVPRWSPDGREVFYIGPDLALMSVSVEPVGGRLRLGTPERLFQTRLRTAARRDYDVAAGGRFLFNVPTSEQPVVPITVILNWTRIFNPAR